MLMLASAVNITLYLYSILQCNIFVKYMYLIKAKVQ